MAFEQESGEEFWQPIKTLVNNDDVESLVELGLSKEEKLMALQLAVENGSNKIVKFLLRHVDPRESKVNLLLISASKKNGIALKELCAKHAWKKDAINDAYKDAIRSGSFDMINTIYFATGYWSSPER